MGNEKQRPGRGARARLRAVAPGVFERYEALAAATREAGPLGAREVALVKVAVSIGLGSWRSVHAHARKALQAGVSPEALRHAVVAALPTIGLPASLDALRWVDESVEEARTSVERE
jgi:4-carboxymuconolactone decarboxylase